MPKPQISEELQTLKRIAVLLEVIAKAAVSGKLGAVLRNKDHRLIYEQTGKLPVKVLSKRTRLATGTISRLWKQWELDGLLVRDGKSYRRVV